MNLKKCSMDTFLSYPVFMLFLGPLEEISFYDLEFVYHLCYYFIALVDIQVVDVIVVFKV